MIPVGSFNKRCQELGKHPNKLSPDERRQIIADISTEEAATRTRSRPRTAMQMTRQTASKMSVREKAGAAVKIGAAAIRSLTTPVSLEILNERTDTCQGCDMNVVLEDQAVACGACGCAKGFKVLKLRDPKAKCLHPAGSKWKR